MPWTIPPLSTLGLVFVVGLVLPPPAPAHAQPVDPNLQTQAPETGNVAQPPPPPRQIQDEAIEPGPAAPPDPPPLGPMVARLKLLTYNVYGLDHDNCEFRGQTFGSILANAGQVVGTAYDIVALQEYYEHHLQDFGTVCADEPLLDAAQATGKYLNSDNTKLFRPIAINQHNGGVGILTLHQIVFSEDIQWHNDVQWPGAAEGFLFSRIRIPGTGLMLDIYSVHLNSGSENRTRRRAQLEELAHTIRQHSTTSGYPVLVMGDFNIGGPHPLTDPPGNAGYDDIMDVLRHPRDLWLIDNYTADPAKGYTYGCGLFSSDPVGCELGTKRIDFIFNVTDPELSSSQYQVVIADSGVNRVRFKAPIQPGPVFTHYVSDHFGVEATLEFHLKP